MNGSQFEAALGDSINAALRRLDDMSENEKSQHPLRWYEGYSYDDFGTSEIWEELFDTAIGLPGLGVVSPVRQVGGEGQGDVYYIVVKLSPEDGGPDQFFMKSGHYQSYNGVEFYDDCSRVEGREVTTTEYFPI